MSWKDKIFEPEKPKARAPAPVAPPQAQYDHVPTYVPNETSSAYVKLKAKTDFDQSEAGKILKKFLDPLQKLPLDEAMKAKTAMAQAEANSGLTVQTVLDTFEMIKKILAGEAENFNNAVDQTIAREINGRQQQIDSVKKQIEALEAQLTDLTTGTAAAQMKIDHAKADFSSALARRMAEIDQQKQHYQGLLQ